MFEMRNITKTFGAVVALHNASLTVNPGEIMALLGANGSGKSTIVKVLSGLVNQNSGEIIFDGKAVKISSAADSRRLGIAMAYQDLSLIPAMSVIDNIVLGAEPKGPFGTVNKKAAREKAMKYLTKLKINCDPETLVQSLMPSTQSMIEIAKALATEPRLLILDESTASLHSDEVDTLFETLTELKAGGMAIVTVTHRMEEIYRICDKCTILRSGETVAAGLIQDMDLDEVVYHMTGKRPDAKTGDASAVQRPKQGEPVLRASHISMFPKVKDISLEAYKGEIIGIGGLDGQGQSEFLRAILADQAHDSGEITYRGKVVKFHSAADAVAADMGFISGDRARESVFPLRSVAENIFAGASVKGRLFAPLSPKTINEFAQKAMGDYGIVAGSLEHPASSLSGGNQQKLVVGRWLALSPDLLLLDDPTKGVDIAARREIHKILKQCTGRGMAALYVSSDNEELLSISDRVYVFYEGRISAELTGEDRTPEKLVAAMLGLAEKSEAEGVESK